MREKKTITRSNIWECLLLAFVGFFISSPVNAQYYDNYYPQYDQQQVPAQRGYEYYYGRNHPIADLQYDPRDAEMILREQVERARNQGGGQPIQQMPQQMNQNAYPNYYGHRIQDEGQVQSVMAEARQIAALVSKNRNGKSFVIMDKRNLQFYLFDGNGRLLRIGPVAIGKGKTEVGAFETPVGVFPIKSKLPVDDWIRPDWYFREEGEPIPKKWEDRRVPGFFRYKLVFDGTRYIHYAEATGGRLTHGCLGLDWQDAEAVFHTMQVGSYCIIIDQPMLERLARGDFPIQKPPVKKPSEDNPPAVTAQAPSQKKSTIAERSNGADDKLFQSLW